MMLIDDVKDLHISSWGKYVRPDLAKELRNDVKRARPYVFDTAASRKLGEFIRDCPDILADNLDFAKPPFPVTYIEMEADALYATMNNTDMPPDMDVDWKVGFLMNEEGVLKLLVNSHQRPGAALHTVGYQLMGTVDPTDIRRIMQMDPDNIMHQKVLWGSSYDKLGKEQAQRLSDMWIINNLTDMDTYTEKAAVKALMNSVGEMRLYIAALLMLQQKRCISVGSKSWERKMARGKSRVFMAHSTVTIVLDGPVEIRRSFEMSERQSPRAHEVPAHFCHRHGDRACEHEWVARVDEENHWDCPKCGRFRYLRRHHMRGDASKGYVTRDYEVTTQEEIRK